LKFRLLVANRCTYAAAECSLPVSIVKQFVRGRQKLQVIIGWPTLRQGGGSESSFTDLEHDSEKEAADQEV
jgi:hypothetical protein